MQWLLSLSALSAPATSPFVTTKDARFYVNGEEMFVFSANYWQAMNLGAVDSAAGNRTRLQVDLDHMKSLGINNLRIMAASEGTDGERAESMNPSLMKSPGVYDERVLDGLDYAMAEIGKRGMKAVMQLNNYWIWSGGFAQYINWVTGDRIPDTPHWRVGNDPYHWHDGSMQPFIDFSARFYTDPNIYDACQKIYLDHIKFILNRVNPYTGIAYKDDPAIFAWQLTNEPQQPPAKWVHDTARFIKSIDKNHMVSVGLKSDQSQKEFNDAHENSEIDYATVHVWIGGGSMLNSSDSFFEPLLKKGISILDQANKWATQLSVKKPLILQEFGLARDNWIVGDRASASQMFSPDNPTTRRDKFYSELMNHVANYHRNGSAFAGFGFWAYSGEARPYHNGKQGDRWISDPPFEPPGWFAVYNKDVSTFEVMKAALAKI